MGVKINEFQSIYVLFVKAQPISSFLPTGTLSWHHYLSSAYQVATHSQQNPNTQR